MNVLEQVSNKPNPLMLFNILQGIETNRKKYQQPTEKYCRCSSSRVPKRLPKSNEDTGIDKGGRCLVNFFQTFTNKKMRYEGEASAPKEKKKGYSRHS